MLRQRLINRVPKYGNDDDRVDRIRCQPGATATASWSSSHPTIRGGVYQPGFYTVSAHVPMGANVGATPDGRHAGAPLADGGLSPTAGPRPAGRHGRAALGEQAQPRAGLQRHAAQHEVPALLLRRTGGAGQVRRSCCAASARCTCPHVQFNVVSADTLRQAQANPDEFRSLVVRVAGYSAYFTELDGAAGRDHCRTEFSEVTC